MVHATDEELCLQIVESSQPAFRVLYERYNNAIFCYALKLCGSREMALDVVQEVFLKVWVKQKTLNPSLSIKAYLFKCARNLILDHLKKAVYDEQFRLNFLNSYEHDPAPVVNALYSKQLEEIRMDAIGQLPGQRQLIYKLSKVEGLTNQEIAVQLGLSINTVKDQLSKASRFIRQYLHQHADLALLLAAFIVLADQ